MPRILSGRWTWIHGNPVRNALLGLFLTTLYVPVRPLMPVCLDGPYHEQILWQPIDSEFLEKYRGSLTYYGVENWQFGGVVYVRWWVEWWEAFFDNFGESMAVGDAQAKSAHGACQRIAEQQLQSAKSKER